MPLEWTHERCERPGCDGTTDCPSFPTVTDRLNMARAAYDEYAESDGTPVLDFAIDVLLLAQSEHVSDTTLIPRLARQALREWRAHTRPPRRRKGSPARTHVFRCKVCSELVLPADMRDHLAGHSTAAESSIDDPAEFFEIAEADREPGTDDPKRQS